MIKILLLTVLILLFQKPKPGYLLCGLAGFNGGGLPNINKLQILGMLNVQRGKHSCGIAINNNIGYGIHADSEFQDLIAKYQIPSKFDKTNNVIIHTRHATVGAHTVENAHPFGFANTPDDTSYSFIGAHNGSLKNWKELLAEDNIDSDLFNVDSEALLFMIFSNKNFKVLSKYKGAAALLFYYADEPNALYAFRGAAGGKHERPLYYTRHEEGVYFSSLSNSLSIIGNHAYEIYEVPENQVLKFKDGKIEKRFKLSRNEELHSNYIAPVTHHIPAKTNTNVHTPNIFDKPTNNTPNTFIMADYEFKSLQKIMSGNQFHKINDTYSFRNFRYYRNGHIFTGVVDPNDGIFNFKETTYFFQGVILNGQKPYNDFYTSKEIDFTPRALSINAQYPVLDATYIVGGAIQSTTGDLLLEGSIFNDTYLEHDLEYPGIGYKLTVKKGKITGLIMNTSTIDDTDNELYTEIVQDFMNAYENFVNEIENIDETHDEYIKKFNSNKELNRSCKALGDLGRKRIHLTRQVKAEIKRLKNKLEANEKTQKSCCN